MTDINEDDDIDELEYEGHLPDLEDIRAEVEFAWVEAWRTDASLRALFSSSGRVPDAPRRRPLRLIETKARIRSPRP